MSEKLQSLFPKLSMAWVVSLLLTPFLIFSGIFINLYHLHMPSFYKYVFVLTGGGLLFFVSPQLSMIYLAVSVLIIIFNLSSSKGLSLFGSGCIAVGTLSFVFFALCAYFFQSSDLSWALIQNSMKEPIEQLVQAGVFKEGLKASELQLNVLAYQLPSLVIVMMMLVLFVTVIYEKSSLRWLRLSSHLRGRLSYFKLPEPMIWLLITSLAFGYIDFNNEIIKIIALNLLNISVVCYFFQGFAVLFNFFEVFRVGLFTKIIMILCFVIQLSLVTVVIGVLDYWFNFRGRFIKKATQFKERSGL